MLTVTAIAADHLSSTFTNYIRTMANYRDCPQTTPSGQSLQISKWQHPYGERTVDFSSQTALPANYIRLELLAALVKNILD
jgi:hypothetical protein